MNRARTSFGAASEAEHRMGVTEAVGLDLIGVDIIKEPAVSIEISEAVAVRSAVDQFHYRRMRTVGTALQRVSRRIPIVEVPDHRHATADVVRGQGERDF